MPAMFADTKAFGAFAVDDLAQATKFYGETLGVRPVQRRMPHSDWRPGSTGQVKFLRE
jgi:catechol 2,3-dioxygenase-like lactoylglutathione lyase family enzyme